MGGRAGTEEGGKGGVLSFSLSAPHPQPAASYPLPFLPPQTSYSLTFCSFRLYGSQPLLFCAITQNSFSCWPARGGGAVQGKSLGADAVWDGCKDTCITIALFTAEFWGPHIHPQSHYSKHYYEIIHKIVLVS